MSRCVVDQLADNAPWFLKWGSKPSRRQSHTSFDEARYATHLAHCRNLRKAGVPKLILRTMAHGPADPWWEHLVTSINATLTNPPALQIASWHLFGRPPPPPLNESFLLVRTHAQNAESRSPENIRFSVRANHHCASIAADRTHHGISSVISVIPRFDYYDLYLRCTTVAQG